MKVTDRGKDKRSMTLSTPRAEGEEESERDLNKNFCSSPVNLREAKESIGKEKLVEKGPDGRIAFRGKGVGKRGDKNETARRA